MSTVSNAVIIIRARIQIYNIHSTRVPKNSQLVCVSDACLKVVVGLLTAGGGGCGVSWT